MEKLTQLEKEFGFEGTELLAFVKEQQEQRREKEEIRQKEIDERENRLLSANRERKCWSWKESC